MTHAKRIPLVALGIGLVGLSAPIYAQGGSSNPAGATTAPGADSNTAIKPATSAPSQAFFSCSYQATLNFSLLGKPRPSLGHRLNLSHALKKGSIDTRLEYYVDGSYNADPPGLLLNNINEPKFEAQLMFNRPLSSRLGFSGGLLYHDNFRFPDRYGWAIVGLTYAVPFGKNLTLSSAALLEKKLSGARVFYDLSGTLEYRFAPRWNTQLAFHRYENIGQLTPNRRKKAKSKSVSTARSRPVRAWASPTFDTFSSMRPTTSSPFSNSNTAFLFDAARQGLGRTTMRILIVEDETKLAHYLQKGRA